MSLVGVFVSPAPFSACEMTMPHPKNGNPMAIQRMALVATGRVPPDQDTSAIPVGRLGTVDEVTELAMTMLGNAYLTGKVFLLDGGMRVQ